jgi:multidrug efflux pump subunit AcrB
MNKIFNNKHFIFAILIAFTFLGIVGFFQIKQNLFPDTDRPQISVVIIQRGASAKDMAENIATIVEKELYTLDKVRKVSSISKDEVSVITAEFDYEKDLGDAATDVNNSLNKIRGQLPQNIEPPQIYKVSSSTPPVMVISISPKDSTLSLADVRQIVENQIKDKILKLKNVGNVDVFGGYKKEILIKIDKDKLNTLNLNLAQVIAQIKKFNTDIPVGFIINKKKQFLIKSNQKAVTISQLKNIYITKDIKLADIAEIQYSFKENNSLYFGNEKPAVCIAVQRQIGGSVLDAIKDAKQILPELKKRFSGLNFEIADTQEKIIKQSNLNMLEALRDAIIMTGIVVFFFLANIRQLFIVGLSIPFVYIITIAIMWLFNMEFTIVSLTAIILALGLLIDDAVVIIENIERHYYNLKKSLKNAVIEGTKEVMLADFSGTVSTMVMLFPILFIGDYPQRIFRPFVGTLLIALVVSYFVSITFIPIISQYILKKDNSKNFIEKFSFKFSQFIIQPFMNFIISVVRTVINKKVLIIPVFVPLIMLFVMTMRILVPLLGTELMPPMDTGIVKANITFDSNLSIFKVEKRVKQIIDVFKNDKSVLMSSVAVGSEPGVLTMGKGKSIQSVSITLHYIDRFHREKTIWQIENELQKKIWNIPDIKYVDVFDYGATPLSTIKGNLDVMITGPDLEVLDKIGNKIMKTAYNVKGIKSLSRTWDYDKVSYNIDMDQKMLNYYKISPYDVALQLSNRITGSFVSLFNIQNENSLRIRLLFAAKHRDKIKEIASYYIDTPKGKIPASAILKVKKILEPTVITRDKLNYSIDIIGYRTKAAITHIVESFKKQVKDLKLPSGYEISNEGDISQLTDSMGRMIKGFLIGIVLLFLTMVPIFKSFKSPVAIIVAIPLSMIGGMWGLLIMNYHRSMPAVMGLILLSGIIVNNSILLIDFIQEARKKGADIKDAIIESIKIRTRPVLMTAFGTAVGMIPIAMGNALGLERLAPLGAVAIGGLIVGTFLTLMYVPIFYFMISKK